MNTSIKIKENQSLPNGPVLASFLAAGVGCLALGLLTIWVEISPYRAKNCLNLYDPVGPLSGKTTGATLVFLIAWVFFRARFYGRDLEPTRYLKATFILVFLGLLFTFPPFFMLFEGK